MAEDSHYQALAMLRLIYNRLVLPGSTNTAVLILPAANDSICADEVPAAPVVEDFDLEAGLRKAYDSLNSPSASPVVLPASNPVRGDKGKSRKRGSAKKTTETEFQFNDDPILDRFLVPSAVSSEPLKQSREAKLVKIPDYPPGVVCCLPPLQYAQNEQGQVVGVIEETLRLLQRFATPSEPEVELHFYFHRVAMENIMRATHAAGKPEDFAEEYYAVRFPSAMIRSTRTTTSLNTGTFMQPTSYFGGSVPCPDAWRSSQTSEGVGWQSIWESVTGGIYSKVIVFEERNEEEHSVYCEYVC
ncbi:hypothetical protein GGU11DRAFT_861230 [Lentinula aff. detonsa]|uniref:Uncharacterized protein n=1 Tax=Lentinula aff. detonsa TaxID=2804958 RepID=A0AA38KD36_9AGAR|nr:hypothetical protein GGU10DRAFT_418682 [Lentinula aff. detonsa]KAJ3792353.1 hypothetical protein GGU11DRAFT_861230 [Lentinula aff. detonsa]